MASLMCFGNSKLYFKRSCDVCVRSTNETFNMEDEAKRLSCVWAACGWNHQSKSGVLVLMGLASSGGCSHQRLGFTACWFTAYTSTSNKALLWEKSSQLNLPAAWGEAEFGNTPSRWDWIYNSSRLCSSCFPSTKLDKAHKSRAKYLNLPSSS